MAGVANTFHRYIVREARERSGGRSLRLSWPTSSSPLPDTYIYTYIHTRAARDLNASSSSSRARMRKREREIFACAHARESPFCAERRGLSLSLGREPVFLRARVRAEEREKRAVGADLFTRGAQSARECPLFWCFEGEAAWRTKKLMVKARRSPRRMRSGLCIFFDYACLLISGDLFFWVKSWGLLIYGYRRAFIKS